MAMSYSSSCDGLRYEDIFFYQISSHDSLIQASPPRRKKCRWFSIYVSFPLMEHLPMKTENMSSFQGFLGRSSFHFLNKLPNLQKHSPRPQASPSVPSLEFWRASTCYLFTSFKSPLQLCLLCAFILPESPQYKVSLQSNRYKTPQRTTSKNVRIEVAHIYP